MAKAKVVHSEDACTIIFEGDKRRPEPSTGIIKFPGGHVEVTRTSDGCYWAHVAVRRQETSNGPHGKLVGGRVDYLPPVGPKLGVKDIPHYEHIEHLAIKVALEDYEPE